MDDTDLRALQLPSYGEQESLRAQIADALRGLQSDSRHGTNGKVTMRAEDQTLVGYAIGWGTTIPAEPFVENMTKADWATIFRHEQEWKRAKGWA